MDSRTIYAMLKGTSVTATHFGSILAADQLHHIKSDKFYIINTANSHEKGKHWVAVYMGDIPEFFDSLGKRPGYYNFEHLMIRHGPAYLFNSHQIQADGTSTCGQFCIYYIYKRCLGYSLSEIANDFSEDLSFNEAFIQDAISS